MPVAEANIRASLDEVIDDVETSQRIFGWVSGVVGDLARETRNLARTVEQRFDELEAQLAKCGRLNEFSLDMLKLDVGEICGHLEALRLRPDPREEGDGDDTH